jgi:hypothetical protein
LFRQRPSFFFFAVTFAVVLVLSSAPRRAAAAGDPYIQWWTLETAHFRIHYYKGLEPVAEKVASIAEGVNARLSLAVGHELDDVTHIILSDHTDDANGYADAYPYNAIHLWVTAPDDLSPLGDYDDWQLELVTHEHTHVLHTDSAGGVPALVNRIMGKWWLPNRAQPKWILEGLAVLEETEHTTGGRLRSTIFDMYLRADVIEHRLASLDQMSHFVRRWPQGNLWYLYGSQFLRWIADIYGESSLSAVVDDYGQQIVPWGINRSIRRATVSPQRGRSSAIRVSSPTPPRKRAPPPSSSTSAMTVTRAPASTVCRWVRAARELTMKSLPFASRGTAVPPSPPTVASFSTRSPSPGASTPSTISSFCRPASTRPAVTSPSASGSRKGNARRIPTSARMVNGSFSPKTIGER